MQALITGCSLPMGADASAEDPTPMMLYELAIELDKRSAELVDDARRLGLTDVSASTVLTPEQMGSLRAANGVGLASSTEPAPVPWGPPSGPTDQAGEQNRGAPVSSPPAPASASPPAAWAPPGPEADRPTFLPASGPPIPSPASWAPPPQPGPPTMFDSSGPVVDPEPSTKGGVLQIVMIAAVVLGAVGLFAYMAFNGGPDQGRQQRLAEDNRLDDERPPATLATTMTTAVPSTETTVAPSERPGAQYVFADQAKYCEGARGIVAFELRIVAGESEGDWQRARRDALDGQATWRGAVDKMILGASPSLQPDLLTYREGYSTMIDRLATARTDTEIIGAYQTASLREVLQAGARINRAISRNCR